MRIGPDHKEISSLRQLYYPSVRKLPVTSPNSVAIV